MPTHGGLETLLPSAAISSCRPSGQSDSAAHPHLNLTHHWPRHDRVAASAKTTRETVASVRAVCDLPLIAPAVQQITDAWRSQTALPAARFRPDAPALL